MRKKILLIEDEADIRQIASLSLSTFTGWEVLTASSGTTGVSRAAAENPDAILLDLMMPEMDGTATLRLLRSGDATRHIPVIFMTAKVQDAERQELSELGARGVIAKPFDPALLAGQVADALGWK